MHSSVADEDEESSSDGTGSAPNGVIPPHVHHPRSVSASVPDVRRPAVKKSEKRRHERTASGTGVQPSNSLLPPPASTGTSPHTAKETFLNYFFGGPNGVPSHPSSAPGSSSSRGMPKPPPSAFSKDKELLPDLGTRRSAGRASLDAPPTYDMRSLGKHLDASGSEQPLQLSPKEEMETTLIRSLIGSYFGITRQTIQDLVPKAIMHLLVSYYLAIAMRKLISGQFLSRCYSAKACYFTLQAGPVCRTAV